MIDIQRQVWNIVKMVEETNTTITKIKRTILKASNSHWTINVTNIFSISKDLQNLVQSNIENRIYQIQKMLADELNSCKEQENEYMDSNINKIQELYKDKERDQ